MPSNTTKKSKRTNINNRNHNNKGFDGIRDQAATVGEDVRELARTTGKAALDQMDPVERYVREKPLRSVLMAAGVGALIGAIFLRR